jgi:hypothetical protein
MRLPNLRDVLIAVAVPAAAGLLVLVTAWVGGVALFVAGLVVGRTTRSAGWIGLTAATIGLALGSWSRPGLLAGPDAGPEAILPLSFVACVFLFGSGWLFGTSSRLRTGTTEPSAGSGHAMAGALLIAMPIVLFAFYAWIILSGGGCCP